MRVTDKKEARGSLKWIRAATNEHQDILNQAVISTCNLDPDSRIDWVSPHEDDDYAEYRDQDFLDKLGITLPNRSLPDFWPTRGPQWDALGRTDNGELLLVEAKANIPEIISSPTGASGASRQLIDQSLGETKDFLGVNADIPWSGRLYQYANRLAHLYLLRELNNLPAFLVFVYFTGDEDVAGPKSVDEWKAAITVAKGVLGISEKNRLSRYIGDVFLDVRELP